MAGSTEATENGRGPAEASGKCSPGANREASLPTASLVLHSVDVATTPLGVRCGPGVWAGEAWDNREGGEVCEGIRRCLPDLADCEGLVASGAPVALPVRGLAASSALSLSTLLTLGSSEGVGPSAGSIALLDRTGPRHSMPSENQLQTSWFRNPLELFTLSLYLALVAWLANTELVWKRPLGEVRDPTRPLYSASSLGLACPAGVSSSAWMASRVISPSCVRPLITQVGNALTSAAAHAGSSLAPCCRHGTRMRGGKGEGWEGGRGQIRSRLMKTVERSALTHSQPSGE
jgi:hypothetical protein